MPPPSASPATVSGGRTGAYWLAASAMSSTSSKSHVDAGRRREADLVAGRASAEKSRKALVKAGGSVAAAYTSTRSVTPVSGSTHRSTCPMLERAAPARPAARPR